MRFHSGPERGSSGQLQLYILGFPYFKSSCGQINMFFILQEKKTNSLPLHSTSVLWAVESSNECVELNEEEKLQ